MGGTASPWFGCFKLKPKPKPEVLTPNPNLNLTRFGYSNPYPNL